MRRTIGVLALGVFLAGAGAASGQGLPALGPQFQVNTYATSSQMDPAVACDASGNFVVVWESSIDPNFKEIRGQRFDALGNPLGSEFPINTYVFADQNSPRVARKSTGEFAVVWQGTLPTSTTGISLRGFASDGNPLDDDFVVAGSTAGAYNRPSIAGNDDGFVVSWHASVVPMVEELRARRFDWSGAPVAGAFTVAAGPHYAEVAMDPTGRFVLTWSGGTGEIYARAYDAAGNPLGPEFQANTYTTNVQRYPSVAMKEDGSFVVVWQTDLQYNTDKMRGQRFDAAANPVGPELVLTESGGGSVPKIAHRPDGGYVIAWGSPNVVARRFDESMNPVGQEFLNPGFFHGGPRLAANNGRHTIFVWTAQGLEGDDGFFGIFARRGGFPDWAPFTVDEQAGGGGGGAANLNGVLEAGERVVVAPAYKNLSGSPYALAGTASNFTGPAGPAYSIADTSADYGTIPASLTLGEAPTVNSADCFTASGNCFEFEIVGARPAGLAHWDTTYDEALTEGVSMTRTLHVGGSFADVPGANAFSKYIENLFHNGITGGGSCGGYCPTGGVKRQQMAVFLLKAKLGSTYVPPSPTGTLFADVPYSNPFCMWIEDLYNRGITGGCASNPLQYCPDNIVNRQQMAVFLLKAQEGSTYDPPDCAGIFTDVPCTPGTGFSDFIEELYNRQITGGCVLNPLQYCPTNPTNRQQMAAFLVKNFGLVLYGP